MNYGTISRRYARALFSYAREQQQEATVFRETDTLLQACKTYPEMNRILSHRMLPQREKESILRRVLGDGLSKEFQRFVQLVMAQKREEYLPAICREYQSLFRSEKQWLEIHLTTAAPLSEEVQQQLLDTLEKTTRQTVCARLETDPAIIGGFVAHWDTYRLDASVAGRLKQIRQQLIEKIQ
jgi:F-type H+-transporting ATPase subunit delta